LTISCIMINQRVLSRSTLQVFQIRFKNRHLGMFMELCKMCVYYVPANKTCVRSVVAVSRNVIHHDSARNARINSKLCGKNARWFVETPSADGLPRIYTIYDEDY
jgi:hypothetical protein